MTNPELGEAEIAIGGKTYRLALKTRGLIAIQQHFSTTVRINDKDWIVPGNIDEIYRLTAQGSVEHVMVMMWAALLKYHPMSYAEFEDLIDNAGGPQALDAAALRSMGDSLTPDPADVTALGVPSNGNPPKAQARRKRGTGVGSTSRPGASA